MASSGNTNSGPSQGAGSRRSRGLSRTESLPSQDQLTRRSNNVLPDALGTLFRENVPTEQEELDTRRQAPANIGQEPASQNQIGDVQGRNVRSSGDVRTIDNYRDICTHSSGSNHSYAEGTEHPIPQRPATEIRHGNVQRHAALLRTRQVHSVPGNIDDEHLLRNTEIRRDVRTQYDLRSHGIREDSPAARLQEIIIDIRLNPETLDENVIVDLVRECKDLKSVPDIIGAGFIRHSNVELTKYCIVKAKDLIQQQCMYFRANMQHILQSWSNCKSGKQKLISSPGTWLKFLILTYNIVNNLVLTLGVSHEKFEDDHDILGKVNFIREETNNVSKEENNSYSKDINFYADFICKTLEDLKGIVSNIRPLFAQIHSYQGNGDILRQGGFYKQFEKFDFNSQIVLIKCLFVKLDSYPQLTEALRKCTAVYDGKSKPFKWPKDKDKQTKALNMLLHKSEFLVERILAKGKDPTTLLELFKDLQNLNQQDESVKSHFLRVVTPLLFNDNNTVTDTIEPIIASAWSRSRSWVRTALVQMVELKLLPFLGNVCEYKQTDERQCFLYYKGTLGLCKHVYCKVEYENRNDGDNNISNRIAIERDILQAMSKVSSSKFVALFAYSTFDEPPHLLVTHVEEEYMNLSEFLLEPLRSDGMTNVPLGERLAIVLNVINIVDFCHNKHVLLGAFTASNFMYNKQKQYLKMQDMTCAVRGSRGLDDCLKYTGLKSDPLPILSAAPETVLQAKYSTRSEVYVLGQFMNEVLSHGIQSYQERCDITDALTLLVQIYKFKWLPERRPGVPIVLYDVILQCIGRESNNRIRLPQLKQKVEAYINVLSSQSSKRKATPRTQGIEYLKIRAKHDHEPHNAIKYPLPKLKNLNSLEALLSDSTLCPDYEKENQDSVLVPRKKTVSFLTSEELPPNELPVEHKNKLQEPMFRRQIEQEQSFRNDLTELKHENIAKIVNFIEMSKGIWTMVYTLEGSGSHKGLLEFYLERKDKNKFIHYLQVAKGMQYLHSKGLVHGSLQAKYCYIFPATNQVKIGRLGRLSQLHQAHQDLDKLDVMTYPFDEIPIDIRRFMPDEVFSIHSDIAMYGFLILQLENAGYRPEEETVPYYNVNLATVKIFQKCGLKPYLESRPRDKRDEFIESLILKCIQHPAHKRPLFSELIDELGNTGLQRPPLPPLPLECSNNNYAIVSRQHGSWSPTNSAIPDQSIDGTYFNAYQNQGPEAT